MVRGRPKKATKSDNGQPGAPTTAKLPDAAGTAPVSPLVSADARHNDASSSGSETDSERWPWGIASVALVAGLAQILASVALGMARLERFNAAAAEPLAPYLVIAALVALAALSVWVVRERMVIAAPLALVSLLAIWGSMRGRTTGLGLAYHGEFVLHHFNALLCLVVAVSLPIAWARDPRLGKARFVPALLVLPGALMLAAAHLGDVPIGPEQLSKRQLATAGAAILLVAWPATMGLFWTKLTPPHRRLIPLVLLLPLLPRLGFVGWQGLSGELVPEAAIPWIGAAIIATSFLTLVLLRPRLEPWVTAIIGVICLLGTGLMGVIYLFRFGELDDDLSGLLQSLFGFVMPYPSYLSLAQVAAMLVGLAFAFITIYASLVSTEDRTRGVALGLMLIAGIGFSSPHLALMFGVGALLFIETLLPGAPYRDLRQPLRTDFSAIERELAWDEDEDHDPEGAAAHMHETLTELADRLGLDAPTTVALGPGETKLGLRGELDGPVVDLVALVRADTTRIELSVGLPGRRDPVFELIPDPGKRGQRPAHLIARSHRVHGELRALEELGDAPLDALSSFPTAYVRAWYGGIQVEFGRELSGFAVDPVDALIRALIRALQRPEN